MLIGAILASIVLAGVAKAYRACRDKVLWSFYVAEVRAEAAASETVNEATLQKLLSASVNQFRDEHSNTVSSLWGRSILMRSR